MQTSHALFDLEYVQQAYKTLRYKASIANSPLLYTAVVTHHLHPTQFGMGVSAREHILLDLLVDTLTCQLNTVRQTNGYGPVNPDSTRTDVATELAIIGRTTNRLLLGYSMLYCRYIRVDLDLRVDDITQWLGLDDRFLRRCATVAWQDLQQVLVSMEMDISQQIRQLDCQLALPQQHMVRLDSQYQVVRRAIRHLTTSCPAALLLYGPAGSGKTALALQICQTLLEEVDISDVAWVNLHEPSQQVPSQARLIGLVCNALGVALVNTVEKSLVVLSEYIRGMVLRQEQFIVVLDGADRWHEAVRGLTGILRQGMLIVTSQRCISTWMEAEWYCHTAQTGELDEFARFLDHQHDWQPSHPETRAFMREMADGNLGEFKNIHSLLAHIQHEIGS